ncbi:hypothetical protein GKIL_2424 [Gloeobacter kilaueensis JS1]|uniref:Uncharacterized protein n=1 Tax=Gloeobacter kilaueensis (strain ATCC BAA-2537 / CCAP 1431/1 / ULC 316 / JS1) TaxID=1183438 RepID=U5QLV4_GLOK1|nr:hypothetical protein GKIL_2424 [Gloeobacter kilaueensis JS1]
MHCRLGEIANFYSIFTKYAFQSGLSNVVIYKQGSRKTKLYNALYICLLNSPEQ